MLPILVSVFVTLPVFKPPEDFEPEWLVPADANLTGGANYVAINTVTGKRYEGETVNFKRRHKNHKNNPYNPNPKRKDQMKKFYNLIRKHGFDKFKFYFRRKFIFVGLEKLNPTERQAFNAAFKAAYLHPCETYWIRLHNLIKEGYNSKESGEGGAGHIPTAETQAKMSESHKGKATKRVTRCEILQDGEIYQKVRLTSYKSVGAAGKDSDTEHASISAVCLNHKGHNSAGGYIWWFTKDTDIFDKDIDVPRVGNMPQDYRQAIISVLPLGDGKALEQWHASMNIARHTLTVKGKKVFRGMISLCCSGERSKHQGYHFRKVTIEKKEDFTDGKREVEYEPQRYITNTKKRKRSN